MIWHTNKYFYRRFVSERKVIAILTVFPIKFKLIITRRNVDVPHQHHHHHHQRTQ